MFRFFRKLRFKLIDEGHLSKYTYYAIGEILLVVIGILIALQINNWNENNKTSFNFVFRDNTMNQNPSYRVRQFRDQGQLTGFGSGEVNSNQFRSFVGLIQHKLDFNFANSKAYANTPTPEISKKRNQAKHRVLEQYLI